MPVVASPIVLAGGPRVPVYPLRFAPVLKHYTWGGRRLAARLGRDAPAGPLAESWEISAHANGPTPVTAGPLAGADLAELLGRMGLDLVGRRNAAAIERRRFPLLVKLLDAAEWLSVQVHPDDRWALARENDQGKTEMWVVLEADPGAELIFGFEPGVDRDAFAEAIEGGEAERWLHRAPVARGDVFFLRPGTVHALGPGILLAEIQQSSDVTYRVFDWNRGQPDRPLHLDRALAVLDFRIVRPGPAVPVTRVGDGWVDETLATCPHFETRRLRLGRGAVWRGDCDGETFEIWGALEGSAALAWSGGEETLEPIEWTLLPASLGEFELRAEASATLLRALTPAPAS